MTANKLNGALVRSQIFSGIGLGLLIGIIVGLSTSEVVSIILGALAALLAGFLGFQNQKQTEIDEKSQAAMIYSMKISGLRAGSFGLSCVFAILLGVFLRTHQVLSPKVNLQEQLDRWTDVGYDTIAAQSYVVYQNLELLPQAMSVQATTSSELRNKSSVGGLFAGESELNLCSDLSTENKTAKEILNAYQATGNEELKKLADRIKQIPSEKNQLDILKELEKAFCGLTESFNIIESIGLDKQEQDAFKNTLIQSFNN